MVSSLLKLMHREFSNINQAAMLLAVSTFVTSLLGLLRDRLFAGRIGAGVELDIYINAFRVPDLVFAIGASLASVTILMPFLVNRIEQDESDGGKRRFKFLNSIFTVFFLSLIVIAVIIFFLMPLIAPVIGPGFSGAEQSELVRLSRIMLLSPIILGISNLYATITQAFKRFAVYALAPALYNIGIILGIVALYPVIGTAGLAWGVVGGAILHALIQVPVVVKQGLFPRFTKNIQWPTVREVFAISVPRSFTLGLRQLVLLALTAIASTLAAGSISIFHFAFVLQSFPFAIIGMSYSIAAFPTLVHHFTSGDMKRFAEMIVKPARQILMWSFPIIVLFVVLRAQIVRVILGTGEFGWDETRLTAAALALFVVSVGLQGLNALVIRGYYAAGRTWRPLIINSISSGIIIGLSYWLLSLYRMSLPFQQWFEGFLRVRGAGSTEILMLALAFMIGTVINFVLLWFPFHKEFLKPYKFNLLRALWQMTVASLLLGITSWAMLRVFDGVFNLERLSGVFLHGFVSGMIGIAVGLIFLILVGNHEVIATGRALRSKFWKAPIIADTEISE